MGIAPIRILLVEDEVGFAEVVSAELSEKLGPEAQIDQIPSLSGALGAVEARRFDAILLDLGLPDSDGVAALEQLIEVAPDTPIVVLTARDQPDLPLKAIRAGAQDFLPKTGSDSATVARALTYAIERHRLIAELNEDLAHVQRSMAGADSDADNSARLSEDNAEDFQKLVSDYTAAIEYALAPTPSSSREPVAKRLRALAVELGAHKGTPRDVVDIHVAALSARESESGDPGSLATESHLLLVELMGHLASFYRQAALSH